MFNYVRMQRQASELIKQFGINAIWRQIQNVNNDEGYKVVAQTTTDHECHVVLLQRNLLGRKKITDGDTEQRTGEIKALMAHSAKFTPRGKDVLIVGTEEYRVMSIDPLKPAGTTLLYKLELQV